MSSSPETFSLDPSSSSSSNNPRPPLPISEYEVFLSFRGPDVRQTFADHLYSCFARSKIRTFRDEEELRKGEVIAPSLVRAIKESKIHIPIFTENYAASKWCLQELAQMVRCWKERKGHIILPIFYFVDPRDVRHQIGPYWEAFEQHSLKHDLETTREWRESLQEVGKMKGWHITKSSGEGAMIDQIFTEVELRLRTSHTLLVTDQLVGVNFHVQEVMRLLTQEFADERMVGIYGMGGLGKTTIAKAVYNKVNMHFDRCCFIENIRQILSENGGVEILQNKIISSILKNDREIKDTGDRIHQIKNRVCKHKILIVLDDVDGMFQFEEILGNIGNFSSESRFIVTTRDIRINEKDEFWMHDHIRDLGRAIVREENFRNPGKRSRVWSNKDALNMLESGEGTDCVEVLRVDMEDADYDELTEMDLEQLTGLRYLEVRCGSLTGDFTEVLPNIRWLRLHDCDSIPTDMDLEKLIVLDMKDCPVKDSWRSWNSIKGLESLHTLEIVVCKSIRKLPDLSGLRELEWLCLDGCTQLTEVPGLGRLESLEYLSMAGCSSIKRLPDLSGLNNLTTLNVRKCPKLKELKGLERLEMLQVVETDKRLKVRHLLRSVARYGKRITRSVRGVLN
ncbi:unnamed protein product [Linum tenue]|uniref:TIR domain-containing protein n=1 Tax=Linum tenue TaxID=586396 RepID=A0AAV0PRN3_9ROSI|nr:unnamed protein product [Linum tenue]